MFFWFLILSFFNPCAGLHLPKTWEVRSVFYADLTGDGIPECVLAVWRPWRDWPIQRWATGSKSPIYANRDPRGRSSHLILVRPTGGGAYREIWAGSPLMRPLYSIQPKKWKKRIVVEALEGNYHDSNGEIPHSKALWEWDGFGFKLVDRTELTR